MPREHSVRVELLGLRRKLNTVLTYTQGVLKSPIAPLEEKTTAAHACTQAAAAMLKVLEQLERHPKPGPRDPKVDALIRQLQA